MNVLDAAFSTLDIWERPNVRNKIRNGFRIMWNKCLDRMWHSEHEESPRVEQIGDGS